MEHRFELTSETAENLAHTPGLSPTLYDSTCKNSVLPLIIS